jgi:hypothetical protein
MRFCKREKKGDCLAALKALVGTRGVRVELEHGLLFIDEVMAVVNENGDDYAVFGQNARVPISSIESVELA